MVKHIAGVKLEHGKGRRAGGSDCASDLFLLRLLWLRLRPLYCRIGG